MTGAATGHLEHAEGSAGDSAAVSAEDDEDDSR